MKIENVGLVKDCLVSSIYSAGEGPYDFRSKVVGDIKHTELVLGAGLGIADLAAWDRKRLWTEVAKTDEHSLRFCVKLSIEIEDEDCIELAYRMARFLIDERKKGAVDIALHGLDSRGRANLHLHFLVTHMQVTPDGIAYPSAVNYWREEIRAINKHWGKMLREFIAENGLTEDDSTPIVLRKKEGASH